MKVDAKLFGKISFFRTTEKYKQIIWEALNIFISCKCSLTQKSSLLGYFGKKTVIFFCTLAKLRLFNCILKYYPKLILLLTKSATLAAR